ncbi:MAG: tetratricopeptide repeat protein, partial [Saprospiraceae bacterium]
MPNTNLQQLYQTANQQLQKGQYAQAWESFQKILQADNNHLLALLGMGRLLVKNKKYSEALPYLERLVHLHPPTFEGWSVLGIAYAKTEDKRALAALRKALNLVEKKTPQWAEVLYQMTKLLRDSEQPVESEKLVDR